MKVEGIELPFWAWHTKSKDYEIYVYRFVKQNNFEDFIGDAMFKINMSRISSSGDWISRRPRSSHKYAKSTVKSMKDVNKLPENAKRLLLQLILRTGMI